LFETDLSYGYTYNSARIFIIGSASMQQGLE
jgi:hypothetical protein